MLKYFVFLDKRTLDYVTRNSYAVDFEDYKNMPDHYTIVFEGTRRECLAYTAPEGVSFVD